MRVPISGVERSADAGTWAVLTLRGETDLAIAPLLRAAVDELVAEDRVHLVWDLADVTFMDSAGLGIMAYAMRSAEARRGELRLAQVCAQVRKLLELTGLDTVVGMYPDVASAAAGPVPR
ncbi:STAS domain-containing protein [Streptomyces ziwulingensis]|uniref:Anti-sigma factor antagonist n=1 Tax=Streptomyces ziwulingensis TaxID=1045501 RepID=A0ABP9C688_9ACTN